MKDLLSKVSFKAVILGALVNIIGTTVWGFILISYVISTHGLAGLPVSELTHQLTNAINDDLLLKSLNWIMGGLFSILGGFIASQIAKKYILLNAGLSSFICVALVGYGAISAIGSSAFFWSILAVPLNILLALIGGFIYKKTKRS